MSEHISSSTVSHDVQDGKGYFRFHVPHTHLASVFGDDWFALKAEAFARFFGTPVFLIAQTVIVAAWILVNIVGWWVFDVYPFILLNLAFSLQAAYAAPLILLAQTRQADRDKMTAIADAQHREELHRLSEARQDVTANQTAMLVKMLDQNTQLTETVKALTERVEQLTMDLHSAVCSGRPAAGP
ncbi:MAG TPA: DUF1003 domain-containing protein [Acetobacteraceae bacterium]|nr:DUF1003 domain-containing protein [Acetobacteraceae bacterium]